MNLLKKSQAKTLIFLFTGLIIIAVALLRHPSIKAILSYNSHQTWQEFIKVLENESDSDSEAQDIWKFREFYSRGTIYLSKYQELSIPADISNYFELPTSFIQYLSFNSSKVQSIEGSIDATETVFFDKEEILKKDWTITIQTDNVQVIEQGKNKAIIIGLFDIQTAAKANGYLYFDLRNDDFKKAHKNKKWLVVSYVQL